MADLRKSALTQSRQFFGSTGDAKKVSRQIALARRIAPIVEKVCHDRFVRLSFSSPGQVHPTENGKLRLVVSSSAQAYRLKNLLPSIRLAIETQTGFLPEDIEVAVNPEIGTPLTQTETAAGIPRRANPEAAKRMREKAERLPEGSVLRKALEDLASSLE